MDCIFCKIIKKELPSFVLYEDDDFIVILDRFPASKGHTLIITKTHAPDLFALDTGTAAKVLPLAKEISGKLKTALGCEGLNIIQNNGEKAGQTVPHFHLHLIPRYTGDDIHIVPAPTDVSLEELENTKNLILGE